MKNIIDKLIHKDELKQEIINQLDFNLLSKIKELEDKVFITLDAKVLALESALLDQLMSKVNDMLKDIEQSIEQALLAKIKSEQEALDAAERARQAKLGPKELANELMKSYITVSDVKVSSDNVRNGFFELDWNDYFVLELREQGYTGETQEEIVDKWFQDLCRGVGADQGVNMERRGSGYVNFNRIDNERSEVG